MDSINRSESKYYAFISYSHKDSSFARKLHRRLENYNISTITGDGDKHQKLFPICRDETAFSSGNLSEIIFEKLDESKKLIVICTKTAASSEYVCEEVKYFAEHYGIENIVPIIAEKYLDEAERISMLPGILKDFAGKKLAVYRYEGSWRQMFLKTVSGVLDVSYETIEKRDARMRKKQVAVRTALLAIFAVILAAVAFSGIRGFKKDIIAKEVAAAQELCGEDLYRGMEKLLELEKTADFWRIDKFEINNAIRKNMNFEKGATLRINQIPEYPDHKYGEEFEFVDAEKSMIIIDGIVYSVKEMKKVFEIRNDNIFLHYGSDGKVYTYKIEDKRFYLQGILYKSDEKKFYIDNMVGNFYIYDADNKQLTTTDGFDDMFVERKPSVNSSKGKIFKIEENGYFKVAGIENCKNLQLSQDEKVLFVFSEDDILYAVNTDTMKVMYTIKIPYYSYNFVCDNNKAAIYLDLIDKSMIIKENVFYIYFDVATGKILDQQMISHFPPNSNGYNGLVSHFFDISDDGKNILYNTSEKTVILKNIETGEEQRFEYDNAVKNLAFYDGGNIFRVFLKTGESHTVSACSQTYVREMRCTDIVCDEEKLNNCLVVEGNVLAKPYNYGKEYKIIYKTDKIVSLSGQTKNYFIFYEYSETDEIDSLDDFHYYKCDKNTLEISFLGKINVFEPESYLWDYEKDVVYDALTEQYFSLADNIFVEIPENRDVPNGWVKVGDTYMIEQDKSVVYIAKIQDGITGKKKLIEDDSSKVDLRIKFAKDGFVVYNDKRIAKFDNNGTEVCNIPTGRIRTRNSHGTLLAPDTLFFDKDLTKVCYADSTNNRFKLFDLISGKLVYEFKAKDNHFFPEIENYNPGIEYAAFNETGDRLFMSYVDTYEQLCKTNLIDTSTGKVVDVFEGYPVVFGDYWEDAVIFDVSVTGVKGLKARLADSYNAFTFTPIFKDAGTMIDEAECLINNL